MKLFRKGSNSTSVPSHSEHASSSSKVTNHTPDEEKERCFNFNCCRRRSVVEHNVERLGLGESGEEFALISVSSKQLQQTPSSSIYMDQRIEEPLNLKEKNIGVSNTRFQSDTTTMEAKPLEKQHKSVISFRKVKSTAVISTQRNSHSKTLDDTVPLQRQGFSLISFRRNRAPRLDENVEKIYSDVGSEYALIKVVSKLDPHHEK